jgi:hypothetical protein
MKQLLLIFSLSVALSARAFSAPAAGEYIFLVGGPSMHQWEKYKTQPHDHWWANFVHAARIRTEQFRSQLSPDVKITWLVYKQGYVDRAEQDHQDLISLINSVGETFHFDIIYFNKGDEVINYLNNGQPRDQLKVAGFEYFGHSNSKCFMFDYSNNIDSACKSWLHENDFTRINRKIFARRAFIKSWGCHTGESMSKKWHAATGLSMVGAIGKTQFMNDELPILTSANGKWVY